MADRGVSVPRAIVAVGVVLATVVAGAGIASAHGGFAVTAVGNSGGAVGVPVTYGFFVAAGDPVAAGADSGGDHERIEVDATVTVDGEVVERRSFTVDARSTEQISVSHAFESAGNHTLGIEVTYSSGDWSETESATTDVEVAAAGTAAALELCTDEASADFSAPYELECHLEHDDGPLGGLLGGLVASWPIVAIAVAISLAVIGTVAVYRRRSGQ